MKAPQRLQALIDEGLIDTVVRQLMSGKEAMVYVVRCGDETRCAKVYKEADKRSFRQAVDYTENRRVKNSREARAMAKGTRFGRKVTEAIWQSAEVDALYRLASAGVRVPTPHNFLEGVLENLRNFFGQFAPVLLDTHYGEEIWHLYERGQLRPETELTGGFVQETGPVDLRHVMREVDDAREEEAARRLRLSTPRQ